MAKVLPTWKDESWTDRAKKSLKSKKEAVSKVYKKRLDKTEKQVYNIHKDSERDITPITTLIAETSIDNGQSVGTLITLTSLAERVTKAVNDSPFLRNTGLRPVFAGGCIRDLVLGTRPNDYDLFVDLGQPSDESRDNLDLFLYELQSSGLNVEEQPSECYRGLKDPQVGFESFNVYNCYPNDLAFELQVIAGFYNLENPLDIYDKFDYNLVKGSFDPFTGDIQLSGDFLYGVCNGKVVVTRDSGELRSRVYLNRSEELCKKFGVAKPKTYGDIKFHNPGLQAWADDQRNRARMALEQAQQAPPVWQQAVVNWEAREQRDFNNNIDGEI